MLFETTRLVFFFFPYYLLFFFVVNTRTSRLKELLINLMTFNEISGWNGKQKKERPLIFSSY